MPKRFLILSLLSLFFVGCNSVSLNPPQATSPASVGTPPTTETAAPTASPEPTLTPTQPPVTVWLAPYLPEALRLSIALPAGYTTTDSRDNADITLVMNNDQSPASIQWVFSLVAPFPTITDGVSFQDLQSAWSGNALPAFNGAPLLMDASTLDILGAYWGAPAQDAVAVVPAGQLVDYAWSHQPSLAIVPFEALEPRWKVLSVDGQSPIYKDFDPSGYSLTIPFVLSGKGSLQPAELGLQATNWEASKLTTVAMTGVTAMVRATAWSMEYYGITYPAEEIGPVLSAADITHISNEIPFSPDCPFPAPMSESLVFCSNPKYIDLLKAVGTDIIDLTGDHFMDYGAEATLYSLQMYKALSWPYYAGGANAEEARQPVKLVNNGNKIAFMGCNVGCEVKPEIPCDAIATDTHPGAAQCDFNYINSEVPALRAEGYQVIFDFQDREYYTYTAEPQLVSDFGLAAQAGATIISGDQAHQPHGFAFSNGSFIHYGLGNLFFDQFHYCPDYACDDAFIDRHVFYDGRYISTELLTIRFVDFAKPRFMTPEERAHLLETVFKASGW